MAHPLSELGDPDIATKPLPSPTELRALYKSEGENARRKAARRGLWIAVPVYLLFLIADLLLIPDVATQTIAARLVVGVTVLIVLEIQIYKTVSIFWIDFLCASSIVFGYIFWMVPALDTIFVENLSYYMIFGAIFMMGANLFFSFEFRMSIVTSGVVFLAFIVSINYYNPSHPYWIAYSIFYVTCFVFTSYVNWRLNCERYNVFLNALEAKRQHQEATQRGKALLKLSRTDPLTGLDNRRALEEKLQDYWRDWQKLGIEFVVMLIDIDFFKRFNDAYGHQAGDRCLSTVAKALRELVARYDATISRYGGEEFIVLARLNSEGEVSEFAEAIRSTVENLALKHDERRDGTSVVTASVGAALSRVQSGAKVEKIIHQADRALYAAKASGRNCCRLFDPDDPQSNDISENIAALLKIATSQNLLSLVYQPIRNGATGELEAVEALTRLKMTDGTSVPPSLFIPVAERTGAIMELGRWAVRTACNELLVDEFVPLVTVNVSPMQLRMAGFAASVAAILGETGVSGNRLAFEVTEGLEMEMHSDVLRCISELKMLGIEIWLDDFGTGFAGLSWLRLIDFDTVKIDRSFLHDCTGPKGKSMLRDIIGLVRNRGHKIVVEGVETEDQMELLNEFHVEQIQGYHIGRPAPAEYYRTKQHSQTHSAQMRA